MSRIRTVKPEFFASTSAKGLSLGARLLFVGLFTEVDDEGRAFASTRKIAGNIFPHDEAVTEAQVGQWLDELEAADKMIERYEVGGVRYLQIPKFRNHQRVSHPTPSRLPAHPADVLEVIAKAVEVPPEVLPKSSGGTREPLATDLGSGIEVEVEVEGRGARAARMGAQTPRAKTLFGGEEAARTPTTPQAVLEDHHYGKILREKFPALDGNGPRPSLIGEITSDFRSFEKKYRDQGRDAAYNGLISWIAKRYGAHEASMRRQGGDAGLNVAAIVGGNRKQSDA